MGSCPTGEMVPAFSGILGASTSPGRAGDSSPSTMDSSVGPTTEGRTTSIETTPPPVGSTETKPPEPTETMMEPPTSVAEWTTYQSGADRLTVKGVDAPGSTSGRLTVTPPNTGSLGEFYTRWCGPCKDQMSTLRDRRSTFSRRKVSYISTTHEVGIQGSPQTVILPPDGPKTTRHLGTGSDYVSDTESEFETAEPT